MSRLASQKQLRLIADTIRSHRTGIVLWMVVGAATQFVVTSMLAREFSNTPGGGRALAPTVEAAAQALRVLRWPAERLDTLGGYITYHNITLLPLLLGLYAAMQGAQALRGAEADGSLEQILATGRRRVAVLRDRVLGFLVMLSLITLGIAAGTAAGLAAGGEPNAAGSFISVAVAVLCAFTFYALALLLSQVMSNARNAVGVTALVMTALYVFTNVWDKAGPFAAARFLSPFFYFQQSRVLVPGHGFDLAATLALVGISLVLLSAAAWAFERRDYASTLWARPGAGVERRPATVQGPWLATLWSASLVRQRYGLLAWVVGTAFMAGLIAYLEPEVRNMWDQVDYFKRFIATGGEASLTEQYLSFTGAMLAPIVAAYATTQVASWISELRQGRVELLLSSPVSWTRMVVERLLTLTGGAVVIIAAANAGLILGALAAGVTLRADGLLRLAADALLFSLAIGAVGAVLAAVLRSGLATALLSVFLVTSYLVELLAPVYDWPEWTARLSVFDAFGRPHLEVPAVTGLALLAGLAVIGTLAAAWTSERSAKVA